MNKSKSKESLSIYNAWKLKLIPLLIKAGFSESEEDIACYELRIDNYVIYVEIIGSPSILLTFINKVNNHIEWTTIGSCMALSPLFTSESLKYFILNHIRYK